MKKLLNAIVICFGLNSIVTAWSPIYAESRPGALSITGGGGYEFFSSKRRINNNGLGFLAVGYDFTCNWGVEAFFAGFRTSFKRSVDDSRRINGTLAAFDAVFHFSPLGTAPYSIQPYLLAGFGATGLNPTLTDANNEGNINGGVGFAFSLHRMFALRFEARDFYTFVGGKNDVTVGAGLSVIFDTC
jgi:hypothetical protein